jgi:phosphatidylserine decarboxylase
MTGRLFVLFQHLLPRHALTAIVHRLARLRNRALKNAMIRGFVRLFDVDLDDAASSSPDDYETFNAFFIRELAEGARPIDPDDRRIVSPVDGTIHSAAALDRHSIVQAKGIDYTLDELFAIDLAEAHAFTNGSVATIYLAPYNYHRVHVPFDASLVAAHYVPGDLFSVNAATTARIPGLFHRNERLNLHFSTGFGPAALILVGALNVGSISTPWTGEIRPRKSGVVETIDVSGKPTALSKGDLVGWFNMGSTVILLLPEGAARWLDSTATRNAVRVGQAIAERLPDHGDSDRATR